MHKGKAPYTKRMKQAAGIVLIAIFFCITASCSSPPGFIENEVEEGIYGHFFESGTDEVCPGVLLLMGGSGYAPEYDEIAEEIAYNGYNVLVLDYYGGGKDWGGSGIDSAEDIQGYNDNAMAGLDYLANLSGVDKEDIGIVGFSYGALLSFNLAYENPCIKALVDIYGYMEFGPQNDIAEEEFITFLPPTCFIHGKKDKTIKPERAQGYAEALEKYNIAYEFHWLSDAGHGFIYGKEGAEYKNQVVDLTVQFLNKYLK